MNRSAININEKFGKFTEQWAPKIVAQVNNQQFKLARIKGSFIWHSHDETEEAFIVLDGQMTIHFRDRDVALRAGEMYVVPRGVEHNVSADEECRLMLVEAAGTRNTGDKVDERTAEDDVWI